MCKYIKRKGINQLIREHQKFLDYEIEIKRISLCHLKEFENVRADGLYLLYKIPFFFWFERLFSIFRIYF